ncbi:MAG: GumC family protein, partial [Fervidobacterium sp.]
MGRRGYLKKQQDELSISELINIILKRKNIAISTFIIVSILTILYLISTKPTYEAFARLKVPQNPIALSGASLLTGTSAVDIELQKSILLSRPVLENVVNRTGLLEIIKEEEKKSRNFLKSGKEKNELNVDKIIDWILGKNIVSLSSLKNSTVLELRVEHSDKELALKILTVLVEEFIKAYVKLNKDEKTAQLEVIQQQISKVYEELVELEEKIKEFKVKKSYSPSTEAQVYFSRLMSFTQDKNALEIEYTILNEDLENIKKQIQKLQGKALEKDFTPKSSVIEAYSARLYELQINYNTLLLKYTEDHPEVLAIKKQIQEIQKQIDAEIKRIASSQLETPNPLLQSL